MNGSGSWGSVGGFVKGLRRGNRLIYFIILGHWTADLKVSGLGLAKDDLRLAYRLVGGVFSLDLQIDLGLGVAQ